MAKKNYLDLVPRKNEMFRVETDDKGKVTIFIENKGVFNKIAQKLLKKPRFTRVHLDEMGNFIWPLIDGHNSVNDIAMAVKAQFGEKAEPLYNRLVTYMQMLASYQFIIYS